MFDKQVFEKAFTQSIEKLIASENVTRKELKELSRSVLEAWHATGNVMYANRLLKALTPMNKKTCVVFFKHFAGFSFDDVLGEFTHKSKKRYDKAHAECVEFLADPNQNIWTWAERHIEIEAKAFKPEDVTKYMTRALKQSQAAGVSQAELLRAVFKAGIDPQCILEVMDSLGYEFEEVAE